MPPRAYIPPSRSNVDINRTTSTQLNAMSLDQLSALTDKFLCRDNLSASRELRSWQLHCRVEAERQGLIEGLLNQMQWQPACSKGGARLFLKAQSHSVPTLMALFHLDGIRRTTKTWTIEEFEHDILKCPLTLRTPKRGHLRLLDDRPVSIHFNFTTMVIQVEGLYGVAPSPLYRLQQALVRRRQVTV